MQERNVWVDYAKAIGIILVVYGHVARGVFNAGLPMDEGEFVLVDSIIYSFHMPLFFFLSGLFFRFAAKAGQGRSDHQQGGYDRLSIHCLVVAARAVRSRPV